MKLIELNNFGDDGFQQTERGTPTPCIGEVVIKVHAASLNFRDFMIAKGLYNPNIELPLVPLSDGAGEVIAVGNDVTEFNVGDRVTSVFWQDWNANNSNRMISTGSDAAGVLSEYAVLPKEAVLPIPEYMSYHDKTCIQVWVKQLLWAKQHIQKEHPLHLSQLKSFDLSYLHSNLARIQKSPDHPH